jgi:hypothetical protein
MRIGKVCDCGSKIDVPALPGKAAVDNTVLICWIVSYIPDFIKGQLRRLAGSKEGRMRGSYEYSV